MNRQLVFAFKELWHSRGQAFVLILCVALAQMSIVGVNSLRYQIRESLHSDMRSLQGGDIIVQSQAGLSSGMAGMLDQLRNRDGVTISRSWEFYSMVRPVTTQPALSGESAQAGTLQPGPLLCSIKVVDDNYPLYGTVTINSGGALREVLRPGKVVVGPTLLERFNLQVGDWLALGEATLQIADVVTAESARPVELLNFGPRLLVHRADLDRLGLVTGKSRVRHLWLLRVGSENNGMSSATDGAADVTALATSLRKVADPSREQVSEAGQSRSRLQRFFDNFIFFLSLVSLLTTLLAGIGMQSGLTALIRSREKSVAIMRSLGASSAFLYRHFLLMVLACGLVGSLLGTGLGLVIRLVLSARLGELLPETVAAGGSGWLDIFSGLFFGLAVLALFTLVPLQRVASIRPVALFKMQGATAVDARFRWWRRGLFFAGGLLLVFMVVARLEDISVGLILLGGLAGLFLLLLAAMEGQLRLLTSSLSSVQMKRTRARRSLLVYRQALRSLLRPGNSTRLTGATLGCALSLLFILSGLGSNLQRTFVQSLPEGAPNLFFIDIQKSQQRPFVELMKQEAGTEPLLYPVIRARLLSINGEAASGRQDKDHRGDSLTREFSLTYRQALLGDEHLLEGGALFGDASRRRGSAVPVSILDTVAEMGDIKLGDLLDFNIQGVPLQAWVSSIRGREGSMLAPFFYFVFEPEVLEKAPHSFFAALRVESDQRAALLSRVAAVFPGISGIDITETAMRFGKIMAKVQLALGGLASLSILAGLLILAGSLLASRLERLQEAAYYKVLGGTSRFLVRLFLLESLLITGLSCVPAFLLAQLAGWSICRYFLHIHYMPDLMGCLSLVSGVAVVVVAVVLLGSRQMIRLRPVNYLRGRS